MKKWTLFVGLVYIAVSMNTLVAQENVQTQITEIIDQSTENETLLEALEKVMALMQNLKEILSEDAIDSITKKQITDLLTTMDSVDEDISNVKRKKTQLSQHESTAIDSITKTYDKRFVNAFLGKLTTVISSIIRIIIARKNPVLVKQGIDELVASIVTIVATAAEKPVAENSTVLPAVIVQTENKKTVLL